MRALKQWLVALALVASVPLAQAFIFSSAPETIGVRELPPEGRETLQLIKQGGPFPHPKKDGSTFGNFEKRLPQKPRGYYREYTVPTPGAKNRGARRIVAGQGTCGDVRCSGEYWYTADHYKTFRRIEER
jgi:ribonuclease T1